MGGLRNERRKSVAVGHEIQQRNDGTPFKDAVINSAITRAQPILLTGLAAMLGAFFILDDPIFNGLAISLIFGILVSTVLTLVVIPLLYFMAYRNRLGALTAPAVESGVPVPTITLASTTAQGESP